MSRRRQRSTTPLEDAKAAIENKNNLSEDDRYTLLSDSLSELDEEQRLSLVKPSIKAYWIDGLSSVIADLPVKSLDSEMPLHYIVDNNSEVQLTQNQMVKLMMLCLVKGCNVLARKVVSASMAQEFVVIFDGQTDFAYYEPVMQLVTEQTISPAVSLVQIAVRLNLSSVVRLLVSKLDRINIAAALSEAIGRNLSECWEPLIHDKSLPVDSAVFFAASYGRTELLQQLLEDHQDEENLKKIRLQKFLNCCCTDISADLTGKGKDGPPSAYTSLEASVFSNHPECLSVLIEQNMLSKYENNSTSNSLYKKCGTVDFILYFCCTRNYNECFKLLLNSWNFNTFTMNHIFEHLLRDGRNHELILKTAEKIKQNFPASLENILKKCLGMRWLDGLFVLVSAGSRILGDRDDHVVSDAQSVLNKLVLTNDYRQTEQIIRNLAVFSEKIDLVPSFEFVVGVGDTEMAQFFLSLNFESVVQAAKKLKLTTQNESMKNVLNGATLIKVKEEVKEE